MISIIGSGNVASLFGSMLCINGEQVDTVYSRNLSHAEELGEKCDCNATDDLMSLADADIYILAVKDDALSEIIDVLCPLHPNSLFVHTAGSVSIDIFKGKAQHYGVIYPLQTISKGFTETDALDVTMYIEASDMQALSTISRVAGKITHNVVPLDSEHRKYLHISAVFACNFVNHCYALAQRFMEKAGCPFSDLRPLIEATAKKMRKLSPEQAQTGPAVRYDTKILEMHEALIDDPIVKDIYRLMSQSIHQTAEEYAAKQTHDQLRPDKDTRSYF